MSFTVTDAFIQQFSGNIRLNAQQGKSRFRGCVIEDTISAESAYLEQVAPSAARKRQNAPRGQPDHEHAAPSPPRGRPIPGNGAI
jgi:hypothetical protein